MQQQQQQQQQQQRRQWNRSGSRRMFGMLLTMIWALSLPLSSSASATAAFLSTLSSSSSSSSSSKETLLLQQPMPYQHQQKQLYLSSSSLSSSLKNHKKHQNSATTQLAMTANNNENNNNNNDDESSPSSSLWDQFRNFWDETMGGTTGGSSDGNENNYDNNYLGLYQIARIPVDAIKPGGLRLFLMLYLMGMQNTPQPKTWKAHQPTSVSYNNDNDNQDDDSSSSSSNNNNNNKQQHVLEMYFYDQSALFRIRLLPKAVILERQGPTPSTAYLMQETLLVDGIWSELQAIATQEDVPDTNRLVLLPPQAQTIMDQAREARLSFG